MEMSLPHNSVFSTKKTPHPTRQELQVSKPSVAFQIAPQQAASLLSHICHVAKALSTPAGVFCRMNLRQKPGVRVLACLVDPH